MRHACYGCDATNYLQTRVNEVVSQENKCEDLVLSNLVISSSYIHTPNLIALLMSLPIIIELHHAWTLASFNVLIVAGIMPLPSVMMSVYFISPCLNRCQYHFRGLMLVSVISVLDIHMKLAC